MTTDVLLVDTMSGQPTAKLRAAKAGSWAEEVNAACSMDVTVQLDELFDLPRERWEPWTASIALVVDSEPIIMGPVTDDPEVDIRSRTAKFAVGGIEDILAQRIVTSRDFKPGEHDALAKSVASFKNMSLGSIAWRLVELAQQRQMGGLPIVHRSPDETTGRERNYEGFNLSNNDVSKRLKELTEVINGPDISFRPEWGEDGRLQWGMWHGTEGQPTLPQSSMMTFDASAPGSAIAAVDVKTSYAPVWRVYGSGAGEGAGTLVRITQDSEWRGPMLEQVFSDQQIDNPDLLKAKIDGKLRPKRLIQFSLEVSASAFPLHLWHVGEWHQVVWPDRTHPLVPGGTYLPILLKRSGSIGSDKIKCEFQAVEA